MAYLKQATMMSWVGSSETENGGEEAHKMQTPNNANYLFEEAVNAVQWGQNNRADMPAIIDDLVRRLEGRGQTEVNRDAAVAALEAASILVGYMNGVPSRYHHLYQTGGDQGW